MTPSQKKRLQSIFARHGVRFAYLFGSRASGRGLLPSSDYDIAVSFGRGTVTSHLRRRLQLICDLEVVSAPQRVDLIILEDTRSATLRYEIAREGKLLYERDAVGRIDFELRTLREYEEFSPFLRSFNRAYIKSAI